VYNNFSEITAGVLEMLATVCEFVLGVFKAFTRSFSSWNITQTREALSRVVGDLLDHHPTTHHPTQPHTPQTPSSSHP
jgi:hypothetical protein